MNIASGTVLGLAAAASAPALWESVNGELPMDTALTRYLVTVLIVWAALSALGFLVGTTPATHAAPPVEKHPGDEVPPAGTHADESNPA